jgi:thymidylate synthase
MTIAKITAIVARRASDKVIGAGGRLPWTLKEDLRFFRNVTTSEGPSICIMGRKTFESLGPQLLPDRYIFVVSKSRDTMRDPRVEVFHDCMDALEEACCRQTPSNRIFVCGGGEVYRSLVPMCDEVILTEIYQPPGPGDVTFPDELLVNHQVVESPSSEVQYSSEGGIPYRHVYYRRRSQEREYLKVAETIMSKGMTKGDRTGTGTISLFGPQLEFDLSTGEFPLLTTKKVFWRGVVEELLWFVRGRTNAKELSDKNVRIWDGNTTREFLDRRGLREYPEGDIGPGYGFQWRHWGATYKGCEGNYVGLGIDQLQEAVHQIKTDPSSRRIIVSAWNVSDIDKMALPPCHLLFQFNVRDDTFLDVKTYQRSADWFLGVPFNIASYALLLHMMCHLAGKTPGRLILTFGDAHIYNTHKEQMMEQMNRQPYPLPKLIIKGAVSNLEDFTSDNFELIDYQCHPPIKGAMAV